MSLRDRLSSRSPGNSSGTSSPYSTPAPSTALPPADVGSQVQYDDVAAAESIRRNSVGAANKLSEARANGIDISGADYEALRQVATKGLLENEQGGFSKLIGIIDGPRQAINLGIQDILNGREEDKGFESPKVSDYVDAVFGGFKNEEEVKFRTGLEPVSGSGVLDMFGWEIDEEANWGERGLRGVTQFGVEVLTDPLTYLTFGLSGLGKKVALESATRTGDKVVANVLARNPSSIYQNKIFNNLDNITDDFANDMLSKFEAGEFAQINQFMKLKYGPDTVLQISENATTKGAQEFMRQNAEDMVEMALKRKVADDLIKPVLNKDFGKIDKDILEEMDSFIRGGVRVTFPFMKGGMMGGYVIPNSEGLGRKIFGNHVRTLFDDVLPKMGVNTGKVRELMTDLKSAIDTDTPWINALKNGDIEPWQYTYITGLRDAAANKANKAEVLARINSSKARLDELLADTDEEHYEGVLKYIRDSIDDRMGASPKHLNDDVIDVNAPYQAGRPGTLNADEYGEGLAEAAHELAYLTNQALQEYRNLVREVAPELGEELFSKGFPQMMRGPANRFLERLAAAGAADSERVIRKLQAQGDHGGYLAAEILGSVFRGGSVEAQLGSQARTGRRRFGRQAVTVLNDLDPETGNLAFLDMRRKADEVEDIAGGMFVTAEAGVKPDHMKVDELNRLVMPHFERLADEFGVSTKDLKGQIFNEDPLEVANRYLESMHEALSALTLTKALQDVGLMVPAKSINNVQDLVLSIRKGLLRREGQIRRAVELEQEAAQAAKMKAIKRASGRVRQSGFKADNLGALRELEELVNLPADEFLAARAAPLGRLRNMENTQLHRMNLRTRNIQTYVDQPTDLRDFLEIAPNEQLEEFITNNLTKLRGFSEDELAQVVEQVRRIDDMSLNERDAIGRQVTEMLESAGKDPSKSFPKIDTHKSYAEPINKNPIGNGHTIEEYSPDDIFLEDSEFLSRLPSNANGSQILNADVPAPWGGRLISNADGSYDVSPQWIIDNIADPDLVGNYRAGYNQTAISAVTGKKVSREEFAAEISEMGVKENLRVEVTRDGRMILANGHHRALEALEQGIDTVRIDIRKGTGRETFGIEVGDFLDNMGRKPATLNNVIVIRNEAGESLSSVRVYRDGGKLKVDWATIPGKFSARQAAQSAPDVWKRLSRMVDGIDPVEIKAILEDNSMTESGARFFQHMLKQAYKSIPNSALEAITKKPAEYSKFLSEWYDFRDTLDNFIGGLGRTYGPSGLGPLELDPAFRQIAGEDKDVLDAVNHLREMALELEIPGLSGVFPSAKRLSQTRIATQSDFVDPSIFKLGGSAVENMVIQKDIAKWMRNLAANNAVLWTPQGVAVAKANASNVVRIWKGLATVSRPSFHLRNTFSAAWNNMAVGVRTQDYVMVKNNALKMRHAMTKGNMSFDEAIGTLDAAVQPYFRAAQKNEIFNGFATTEFRKLTSTQKDTALKFLKYANPYDPDEFGLVKMGSLYMESIEDFMRMAAFVRWYDPADPSTAKVAKEMVEAVHFNYSKLTPFETRVKEFVPFFVWMRRNIPLQMQLMLENPKIAQRYRNLLSSTQGQMDPIPQDEFGESQYLSELAVGTNIVFNKDTPQWARIMFDPDLPVRDLLDLDPTSISSVIETFTRQIGPQFTLPFNLAEQEAYGNVNAPAPIHMILKSLAQVGLYNETVDGNVRIPYWTRTLYDTALPFARETIDPVLNPILGSSDPNRAQREGINLQEDNTITQIAKGVLAPFGRASGISYQTPLDTKSANYATDTEIQRMIYELRLRGDL